MAFGLELRNLSGRVKFSSDIEPFRLAAAGTLGATASYWSETASGLSGASANTLVFMRAAVGVYFGVHDSVNGMYYGANGSVEYRVYSNNATVSPSGWGMLINNSSGVAVYDSNTGFPSVFQTTEITLPTGNIPNFGTATAGTFPNAELVATVGVNSTAADGGNAWVCVSFLGLSRNSHARYNSSDMSDSVVRRRLEVVYNSSSSLSVYECSYSGNSYPSSTPNTWWRLGPPTRRLVFIR